MKISEHNRYQNSITVFNIDLTSVISNSFGIIAQTIMKEILSADIVDDNKISKLICRECKNKDNYFSKKYSRSKKRREQFLQLQE